MMGIAWPIEPDRRLRLRLYGAAELGTRAHVIREGDLPRTKHAGGELFVGVDAVGTDRRSISEAQAADWYDESDVRFPALVRDAARRAPTGTEKVAGGTCVIPDEEQAAAFLIDRDHSARVLSRLHKQGDTVVVALTRTCTVITGGEDEAGIRRILDEASRALEDGSELVSVHPLAWRNGQWVTYDWQSAFPHLARDIGAVVRRFGARQYEAQAAVVTDADALVPCPIIDEGDDGGVTTSVVWQTGTSALLPVVDDVVIDDGGRRTTIPFADFIGRAGSHATRTDLTPTRYRVSPATTV